MNAWNAADAGKTDFEQLVYLSNLIGGDLSLVQPGGGNTSVKLTGNDIFGCEAPALVVKGSGTDLRTITAGGFTHLYTDRLSLLRNRDAMSDEEMMAAMRACMLFPDRDPIPSVETPLHALLPARFVAHTHDVATLSLTDTPHTEQNVRRVFGDEVAFLEYARPGFPLAKLLAERYAVGPPKGVTALVMEKHGLAVWGETARDCYENLRTVIEKAEAFVAETRQGKRSFGAPVQPVLAERDRRDIAAAILPMIRGDLMVHGWRCVLHFDDSLETLEAIGRELFAAVASRGMMTPEHILRAGVRPMVIDMFTGALGLTRPPFAEGQSFSYATFQKDVFRFGLNLLTGEFGTDYEQYAERHGRDFIPDFLKTVVIPGVGVLFAGKDGRNALIARDCYRATMEVMAGAEAVERFEFISEADQAEVEYWPLERRKVEETSRRELDGKVAVVIGAASGIGRATALRFAEEGAHVVLADVDVNGIAALSAEINETRPERTIWIEMAAGDSNSVADGVRKTVLSFGGIDLLFYSPGIGPQYHSVVDMPDEEIEQKLAVHYRGAVAATREVARVMIEQGNGGRLIYNASKAAFAPGEGFAAYGASKAALVHYVRNVATELGRDGITANYINADAIDTPMFREVLRQRAQRANVSEKEMLSRYAERSVLREATVPPEAAAEAALWLASDRSAHTSGCVITVGGGSEGFPR